MSLLNAPCSAQHTEILTQFKGDLQFDEASCDWWTRPNMISSPPHLVETKLTQEENLQRWPEIPMDFILLLPLPQTDSGGAD